MNQSSHHNPSEQETQHLAAEFAAIDADGDGLIDRSEFEQLLQALGAYRTRPVVDAAFSAMDKDGGGSISLSEFQSWWGEDTEEN